MEQIPSIQIRSNLINSKMIILMFKNLIMTNQSILFICHIFLILQLGLTFRPAFAQKTSYRINSADLLEISFWESPDMDQQVRVSSEGNITLPVIGSIRAEGLTTKELSQSIIRQMEMYNKLINQIRIKVLEYGQNRVHVTGQVTSPGKYSFEEIPNIWDIILEAGGPLETAQLDETLIVRNREDGKISPDVADFKGEKITSISTMSERQA